MSNLTKICIGVAIVSSLATAGAIGLVQITIAAINEVK